MLHVCRPPSFVHILECFSANVVDSVYMAIVLCLHKLTPSVISINDNIIEYPLLSVNYAYVITLVNHHESVVCDWPISLNRQKS